MKVIDRACELEQWQREQDLAHHFKQQATQAGTGICCDCGHEIDPKRLAVNPHFERCVMCQSRVENRTKHVRRT
ncbi:TraR/DksA C4-type zinc finger protein [Providencia stuartii]|uniref:TraR/DksA C4-type zinc finger protein n=1 Tax=Providencia stuartii TaxID=588 RepID=UPI0025AAFE72|nr:TraR/DksA C4-type zinc finger protein [Providencia stuartii]MDN0007470.1 TraR/DksA C4-type zinc finger protein [Providencia stuartii]